VENYKVVIGVVIAIVVLLLAGFFIMILVTYSNNRKKKFIQEKQTLEATFNEQLLKSQLEMQEQTFNTISREIHDNVGQVLSLAKVQLNIIDQSESLDRTLLTDAKDSVSKAMTDLRDIAKSLNSERIQLSSLPEITGHELQRINRSGIMLTSISIEGKEQNMQEQKKLIIFRIIQEALHNILKHSQAKNIGVNFCYETDKLKIDITDNGIGFDKELLTKIEGLGLQNIVSRAALIGGEAHINSIINKGTVITIISPYD
jgi:two-component system, NarL family, sensor kinase